MDICAEGCLDTGHDVMVIDWGGESQQNLCNIPLGLSTTFLPFRCTRGLVWDSHQQRREMDRVVFLAFLPCFKEDFSLLLSALGKKDFGFCALIQGRKKVRHQEVDALSWVRLRVFWISIIRRLYVCFSGLLVNWLCLPCGITLWYISKTLCLDACFVWCKYTNSSRLLFMWWNFCFLLSTNFPLCLNYVAYLKKVIGLCF